MRARYTPIQSYSGLGQVRRERQRVVSWSLVPRSGYGILTPSSGVWQAMAGPIDVSATSHPQHQFLRALTMFTLRMEKGPMDTPGEKGSLPSYSYFLFVKKVTTSLNKQPSACIPLLSAFSKLRKARTGARLNTDTINDE
ncbi:hypothetical protein WN51_10333 [Melipona quadrifasciata]|uniref:Uncharacterized protein n=1 Tax=Melipona quadrifasciata TaxID=166423 RepID=A0A0M9A6Z7_9HYME|nr:hypothetical protein WN51_10333 [Melipona quadrifasciata]